MSITDDWNAMIMKLFILIKFIFLFYCLLTVETDFFIQPTSPLVVMFPVGTLPGNLACGPVEIQDDNILDGNKNFRMMLEEDSSIIEVEPLFTNVTILDDDSEYIV